MSRRSPPSGAGARSQKHLNRHAATPVHGPADQPRRDDPAGLIASETLRSEISGINQAIDNSQRATNVIATAEGALNEVASLLLNIKSLVVQAANSGALSPDEIAANQLQVDSAVESITRISNTHHVRRPAPAQRQPRLPHQRREHVADQARCTSPRPTSARNPNIPVQVNVITSAADRRPAVQGQPIASSVTLEITGNDGVQTLTFTSGTTASAIAFAINRISDCDRRHRRR